MSTSTFMSMFQNSFQINDSASSILLDGNASFPNGEGDFGENDLDNQARGHYEANSTMGYLGLGLPNSIVTTRAIHYTFGVVLTFIGIFGAVGNGLVLYVFASK